jgi:hypothetical protein
MIQAFQRAKIVPTLDRAATVISWKEMTVVYLKEISRIHLEGQEDIKTVNISVIVMEIRKGYLLNSTLYNSYGAELIITIRIKYEYGGLMRIETDCTHK